MEWAVLLVMAIHLLRKCRCVFRGHQFVEPCRIVEFKNDGSIVERDHIKHYYCMRCGAENPNAFIEPDQQVRLFVPSSHEAGNE